MLGACARARHELLCVPPAALASHACLLSPAPTRAASALLPPPAPACASRPRAAYPCRRCRARGLQQTTGDAKRQGPLLRELVLGLLAGCFIGFGYSTCMIAAGQVRTYAACCLALCCLCHSCMHRGRATQPPTMLAHPAQGRAHRPPPPLPCPACTCTIAPPSSPPSPLPVTAHHAPTRPITAHRHLQLSAEFRKSEPGMFNLLFGAYGFPVGLSLCVINGARCGALAAPLAVRGRLLAARSALWPSVSLRLKPRSAALCSAPPPCVLLRVTPTACSPPTSHT